MYSSVYSNKIVVDEGIIFSL
ncbi:rCG47368 [Rattus norvegicus]|uniref:RCG47368 n=1 Tax=Rattus norvegicus TaxID=10116 RepID=A6I115_RAT|nr:rCG47368 [Rattus norvegicus]